MAEATILLAYDLGTSMLKAALVDLDGNIIDYSGAAYRTDQRGELAEQRPEDWWDCLREATRQLLDRRPACAAAIGAIGVSGHMSGCLPVDAGGIPLARALTHADARAAAQKEHIERAVGGEELYRKTGCVPDARSTLCKVLWLRENRPDVYRRTAFFLQAKDYVTFRLTGEPGITDFSDASHTMTFDIHRRTYLTEELRELGLSADKFPAVCRGTEVVGRLTEEAAAQLGLTAGTPVVAGGGDGACATAGAGICEPGRIYCSLGTTAWIAALDSEAAIDPKRRLFDIMALDGRAYGVFGTMQAAGRSLEWARRLFELEDVRQVDELAAPVPAGSEGLIFLPYLEGERSPVFDSRARGIYFGIGSGHERAQFLRAALEGVAFGLRSILEVHRERRPFARMRVIGGGARSALWLQIIADVCDIELETPEGLAVNHTALGAAMAAGVGIGAYEDLRDAARRGPAMRTVRPNPENREAYDAAYHKYTRLYPCVRELYGSEA